MLGWWKFTETTPASASTVASSGPVMSAANYLPAGVVGPLDDFDAVDIAAELVGSTGGTLDVYVQTSLDEINWFDSVHFAQLANGAAAVSYRTSITHFAQPNSPAPVVVGKNLSPALAPNVCVQGGWGSRLRLVFVAGAGTTVGASVTVTVAAQRPRVENS